MPTNVFPVADYEPPAYGAPPQPPPVRPCAAPVRPRTRAPQAPPANGPDARDAARFADAREAARFADAALRRVLEVIDRRRPLAQLRPLLAAGLVDSLLPAAARQRGAGGAGGAARLCRVLAQPVRPDGSAAEVAATYSRGYRVHAIACRVERLPGSRWQLVALHMG